MEIKPHSCAVVSAVNLVSCAVQAGEGFREGCEWEANVSLIFFQAKEAPVLTSGGLPPPDTQEYLMATKVLIHKCQLLGHLQSTSSVCRCSSQQMSAVCWQMLSVRCPSGAWVECR